MKRAIKLSPADNVATLLADTAAGDAVEIAGRDGRVEETADARVAIERGHKIALADLCAGDAVLKYGHAIGRASQPIRRGDFVHTHNLESGRGRGDLA